MPPILIGSPSTRLRAIVDLASAMAIIVVAVGVAWRLFSPPPPVQVVNADRRKSDLVPTETISVADSFVEGRASAPVMVVEYGDFQCPACAAFVRDTYKGLVDDYVTTGRASLAFKHFPLPNHPMAVPAAISAQCAGEQGRFWQFYELAYKRPGAFGNEVLQNAAKEAGLDLRQWSSCKAEQGAAALVQRQFDEAKRLHLRATPAFLIGRVEGDKRFVANAVIYGSRNLAEFADAIKHAEEGNGPANR